MPDLDTAARHIHRERIRSLDDIERLAREYSYEDLRPADTIHGCLVAAARESPTKPAIIVVEPPDYRDPARVVTFEGLVGGIEQTANLLHARAGDEAATIAVLLPMVPEGLIALWGAATAGRAVPMNPFLETDALVGILRRTRATGLVTTDEVLAAKWPAGVEALRRLVGRPLDVFVVATAPNRVDDQPEPPGARRLWEAAAEHRGRGLLFEPDDDPWRDAVIMPTGGTTGAPKLVRMSQAAQLSIASNVGALMGCEMDGVVGHGMPNFHCGGSLSLGLRSLIHGMTLLTLTTSGLRSRWAVENFWAIAHHYAMTSILTTPTTCAALLAGEAAPLDGHSLADYHVGGSTLPAELVRAFHDRFGIWLRENWGMTEVHGTISGHPNDGSEPRAGSAGVMLPRCPVRVVELDEDGRWVRDCAPREKGHLLLGGITVTKGYLDERQNAEFFIEGVPAPGRWANTGDIGTLDEDGYVYVSGRAKDLIIRGGHNIDPKQIEDALNRHPAVQLAAAVGRPDRVKGELPIAYVELVAGRSVTAGELRDFCREHVQEKAAAPVEVLVVDRMPLTPVGKIAKPVLRRMALEDEVRAAVAATVGAPCDVVIDESGTRRSVGITLHADSDRTVDVAALADRMIGYEFRTTVAVEEG